MTSLNNGKSSIVLRCEGITRSFAIERADNSDLARLDVLRGISMNLYGGEILSIVGASGSGKSTLLHILGGLDTPTAGKVFWDDIDIDRLSDELLTAMRIRHVGFVFQFHHLLPEFSALENVMIAGMIGGMNRAEAGQRAEELLRRVGLQERARHKPSELSGGEQQRTAVARALANNPNVILADEPSGNLDSRSADHLMALIRELNAVEKQTFVVVTHNERYTEQSDRVLRMADGILEEIR